MLTLRTAIGVTQASLAKMLGVSRQAVSGWEAGQTYPKADHLKHFVALAMQHRAFPAEREAEEIRALWRTAHQKVLLDEHWLHDLLQQPPPPDPPPMPAPLHARPLPVPPTPCIGRDTELAQIAHLLTDPACRVLTICGPGGIGKTRLALEVAARHSALCEQGAVFVELAPVSAVNQIAPTIGDALRLSFAGHDDPVEHLLRALQPLHLLLVLDNLDHLPDSATIVNDIVQWTPHIMIVATSRERLNLRVEWVFDIDGLAYPDQQADIGQTAVADPASYSAVRLFAEQARHIQPSFSPSNGDMQVIARICQQLDGMPLAIELAAAWMRVMSLDEIANQLPNGDLLTTTLRDVPPRHRSLRAVFDQSWTVLSAHEQAVFARLAVFRGGWTLAAASSVAGASAPVLGALIDKSLVRGDAEEASIRRFRMLELLREYVLQHLSERGERAATEQAHARYYLALAETAFASRDGATDDGFDQIEHDYDNLRAVLRWALQSNQGAFGLRLVEALWLFWRRRGYLHEGRQWLADLLALPPIDATPMTMEPRPPGREALAWLASDEQSFTQAFTLFEQGFTLQRTRGRADALTDVLISGARQARGAGDYPRATRLLERELAHYRALVDAAAAPPGALGPLLQELAMVLREQGEYARGQALWQECLDLQHAHGDRIGMAVAQMGLSDVARDRGDGATVRALCEQSLPVFRQIGEERGIGYCLNNLALAAFMDGDLDQAAVLIEESVAIFSQLQGGPSLGEVLLTRGRIAAAQGSIAHARQDFATAARIASAEGPRWLLAAALEALGASVGQHDAEQAARFLSVAAKVRRETGTPIRTADQEEHERTVRSIRAMLGDQRFEAYRDQAATLPLEEVIGVAMVYDSPDAGD
jgi:predicted ATPase/transcriptional regulator with XRE-family HTH domain